MSETDRLNVCTHRDQEVTGGGAVRCGVGRVVVVVVVVFTACSSLERVVFTNRRQESRWLPHRPLAVSS